MTFHDATQSLEILLIPSNVFASDADYAFHGSRQSEKCGRLQLGKTGHKENVAPLSVFALDVRRESAKETPRELDSVFDLLHESL
jgi:hypothetical protein